MAVMKSVQIMSESSKSFEGAIETAVKRRIFKINPSRLKMARLINIASI